MDSEFFYDILYHVTHYLDLHDIDNLILSRSFDPQIRSDLRIWLYIKLSDHVTENDPLILHRVTNGNTSISLTPLLFQLLLRNCFNFDVNYQDCNGNTVLHILWNNKYHLKPIQLKYMECLMTRKDFK